ncbi:MAG: hypothetical protein HYY26_07150 [Acidobacteria bacterium]|nr:hypothetical protein [Acidobacteriota bacterium]
MTAGTRRVALLGALLAASLTATPQPTAPVVIATASPNEIPVVAAWAPDGQRLAYGTEKRVERRGYGIRTDEEPLYLYPGEVWVTAPGGKAKRVLKHDFLRSREGGFFSFAVERVAWSPDGRKLLVEITDERKNTATFLITEEGKRVSVGSGGVNFVPGYGGMWLGDNESVALLEEAMGPRLLHRVLLLRVVAGRALPMFPGRTFAAVTWLPGAQKAVGVEQKAELAGTPRLVVGSLDTGAVEELSALGEGYLGGLRATPDEKKISYFVGQEQLAVRGLEAGAAIEYWPVPFGRYEWVGPRLAVAYIEPEELGRRRGWLTLYDHAQQKRERMLEELIQDFWVSPDGAQVAVLTSGLHPTLKVYPLPSN